MIKYVLGILLWHFIFVSFEAILPKYDPRCCIDVFGVKVY
jgi:hypothetical protein